MIQEMGGFGDFLKMAKEKFVFTDTHMEQLLNIEKELIFPGFGSEDAKKLGDLIIELNEKDTEKVSVRVIRESDGLTLYQRLQDSNDIVNENFMTWKANAVRETGHSSLYALGLLCRDDAFYEKVMTADYGIATVGGAFPIMVNGERVAILAISGLMNGSDFFLEMEGVAKFLGKKLPEYDGPDA